MKVLTDNKYYGQIADVIREQNGTNNTYTPPQMVRALRDLFYEEVEGVPPISFQGIGENLLDYRFDGNSSKNLFNINSPNVEKGCYYDVNGVKQSNANHDSSEYIPCRSGVTYTLSFYSKKQYYGVFVNLWNLQKQFVANIYNTGTIVTVNNTLNCTFTTNRDGYINFNYLYDSGYMDNIMLNEGSTALPYEPYGDGVGERTNNLFDKTKTNRKLSQAKNGDGTMNYTTISSNYFDYYIPVQPNTQYIVTDERNAPSRIYFFKNDKTWIGRTELASGTVYPNSMAFTTPSNCYYIQLQESKANMMNENTLMLNVGNVGLPYESYYKIPVKISGKNLANWDEKWTVPSTGVVTLDNNAISCIIDVQTINNIYIFGDPTKLNSGIYRIGKSDTPIQLGSQTIRSARSTNGVINVSDCNYIIISCGISNTTTTFDDIKNEFIVVEGTTEPSFFEPYYEPIITNIYLDSPIYENESISLSDTNVNIPTIRGTNILSSETTIQPSNVYVKARKESSYEIAMRERYEEAQAQLDALES